MEDSRTKFLGLAIFFAGLVWALLATSSQRSAGQEQGPQIAHLICCNMLVSVPGTWIGANRECEDYLNKAPENVKADVCKQLTDGYAFKDASCVQQMLAFCPSAKPPDVKCEPPPPPWFEPAPECKDVQEAQITQNRRSVIVYLCGYQVFNYGDRDIPSDQLFTDAYKAALKDYFKANVGKVCCDSFRQAARTGLPCNAKTDIDCDGVLNQADVDVRMPKVEGRSVRVPEDSNIDTFPEGMTDDEIAPPPGQCKDCKWVMMSGKLKCSPDGRQRHVYQAKWYCPSSKVQVDKFHYAPATAPCTPPNRSP